MSKRKRFYYITFILYKRNEIPPYLLLITNINMTCYVLKNKVTVIFVSIIIYLCCVDYGSPDQRQPETVTIWC